MKISELSKRTQVSIRMIRYYEERGLLIPTRTASGYRQFTAEHIEQINKIKILKDVGFTIEDIRPVMQCQLEAKDGQICGQLKEKITRKIEQIDQSVANLIQAKATLSQYV
ncbi:MerR family transcriptional regulator [Vibrio mangrovi]|uniref:HTH-type transcriptional regulator HmrR n=1 Tax=Vibrio mangrovi TaxID=474394 RepID=A0A1Y6ITN0_9VIBR|nr:MerR family transcriptional regulator [Vibrio mangrovi]MDW6004748.1 MerR family transcriptional regulator [Vibrio mangrovi]SMS01039.1 HTH-type transcriptional regulator HmrR [Vibrio mangrovi]